MASLNELNEQANALKAAGRVDEALAAYRAIVERAPGNARVIHNLAAALGDFGRNREAIAWAERALAVGIDAPETWLVLARALAAEGEPGAAERAFYEALRRRPTDAVIHRDLAQLLWMRTGDRGRAVSVLDAAIARYPELLDLRLVRARVYGQTGDAAGEYAEVLQVLQLGGHEPNLLMAASNSALAAGETGAALDHARAAAAAQPGDSAIAQCLCRALLALGEATEAEAIATRLRAQFPLDQFLIAIQATAWRLLGDARYGELYDYEHLVLGFELGCPPGWPALERYVDDLVEALDRRHRFNAHPFDQSLRRGSQLSSIEAIDEAPLRAVEAAMAAPVRAYLERVGPGPGPLRGRRVGGQRLLAAWSVRLAASGHHINHVHPQGWLSSAGHLRFPTPAGSDDRSGWLTFGAPGVPTQPVLDAEHLVRPRRGVLVVFPSYMWHGTVPFDAPQTRLSIAADWLPAQAP